MAEAKEDQGYLLVLTVRAEVPCCSLRWNWRHFGECKQSGVLPAPNLLQYKHHLEEYPRETGLRSFQSKERYREQGIKLLERSWTCPSYNI